LLKKEQHLKLVICASGHGEIRRQQGFFTIAQTCPKCGGTGEIAQRVKKKTTSKCKIPAGIDHGQRLKLSGEGDVGSNGGPAGDFMFKFALKIMTFLKEMGLMFTVKFQSLSLKLRGSNTWVQNQ
jgi:DnaJ-class molecular chaperone